MADTKTQIARWWAHWLPEDKRDAFIQALLGRWPADDTLSSDYDPKGPLLDALHAAGVACRGCMFSSKDVGFPQKSGTRIINGVAHVKLGYGTDFVRMEDENG